MHIHRFKRAFKDCFAVEDPTEEERKGLLNLGFVPSGTNLVREFPENLKGTDWAFENFEKYLALMLEQESDPGKVPWESALYLFLELMQQCHAHWWMIGNCSLSVRGIPVKPRGLEIVILENDFMLFADFISHYLVEPLVTAKRARIRWAGRAFLKARIDFKAGVLETGTLPSETSETARHWLETVCWNDYDILVPPLNLQLKLAEDNKDADLAALIRAHMDPELISGQSQDVD